MIDDNSNCPYSYHKDFPGTFLYPVEVSDCVGSDEFIWTMTEFEKAVLYQIILLQRDKEKYWLH